MRLKRSRRILELSLPVVAGMLSQNLFNLVDTAMVGRLGSAAIASVAIGGFAVYVMQALLLGISPAVQALVGRSVGAGESRTQARFLNAALLGSAGAGLLLAPAFYGLTPLLYPFLNSDPEVVRQGVGYLQLRALAIPLFVVNFAFRGYWTGIGQPRLYMATLVAMHVANVVLNYVFIFGGLGIVEPLGVYGAGLASLAATALGTVIHGTLALRIAIPHGFLRSLPDRRELSRLRSLAANSGVDELMTAAGYLATYFVIGLVGTHELAAAAVLINILLVAHLPAMGFGAAAATLVAISLGRKQPEEASAFAWESMVICGLLVSLLGIVLVGAPGPILTVFLHDPKALALGKLPLQITGLTLGIEAAGLVLRGALLGAGQARTVMAIGVIGQWAIFLPLAYLVGPFLGLGLVAVWVSRTLYRLIQAGAYWRQWRGGAWAAAAAA